MIAGLLRLLVPRSCPGCGRQLGREAGLCARCRAELRPRVESHSPLSAVVTPHLVTLGPYQGVRRRAVRALKFGHARDLAGPLGKAIATGIPADWRISAVVPVPLHPRRQRERGFNQAELLAQVIADALGVPCLPPLIRTRYTTQQARQHAKDRSANLAGAFAVRGQVPPGTLLLVDDVLTTGNTLKACRDALNAAGHQDVKYAVIAR